MVDCRGPSRGFGEQGNKGIFSGEQRPKIRGTGEHMQFWGTGNIENQDFVFGEQRKKGSFSRGTGPPPGRASLSETVSEWDFTKIDRQFM